MDLKFKWKDEYCLGNDTIDGEHKKLFEIANKVFSINASESTEKVIIELFDYMRYHFDHEEAYMKEISFGEIDYHKEKHAEIISEMNNLLKETKDINILEVKLTYIMQKWLLVHIIGEDIKIKSPVSSESNEAAPTAEPAL